jgi:ferrochelatase
LSQACHGHTGARRASHQLTLANVQTSKHSDAPIGVLVVNIGSPDAPTSAAVRRYLSEFLGDPDVVRANRVLWWFIWNGVILPLRSRKSARLYASIWTARGSPLVDISRTQTQLLARELGDKFKVVLAMRYGNPSLRVGLDELRAAGCKRLLLLPMFPQFSRATTGSIEKAVRAEIAKAGDSFELSVVPPWFDDAGYIDCLAARVREARDAASFDHLVVSFHGLPARSVDEGDPYRDQCVATANALVKQLELGAADWTLVYQSRFGRERWLEPYAVETLPKLAAQHPRVLVVCPAFVADCLETLEEIRIQLAETFRAAGGREFRVAPCLNEDPRWITTLVRLVRAASARKQP